MYYFSTRTSEANSSETICQPHQDSLMLGPGLNVCLCVICNTTHTALPLAYICLHFQNFMQTTPMGGGMCSPELGCNSAVCMVTLLEPHGPDLIPRGYYAYCKGGAT